MFRDGVLDHGFLEGAWFTDTGLEKPGAVWLEFDVIGPQVPFEGSCVYRHRQLPKRLKTDECVCEPATE